MNNLLMWLFGSAYLLVLCPQAVSATSPNGNVMMVAVSRDASMLTGGIGPGNRTRPGTVVVEPMARVSSSGVWLDLPCNTHTHANICQKFAHEYLSKRHTYTVVSAQGRGATIQAAPTTLDECYGYTGTGKYSGVDITTSAIAASSADIFGDSPRLQLLDNAKAKPFLKALRSFVPRRLDSILYLKIFSVQLGDHDLVVIQRTFADVAGKLEENSLKDVFGIGTSEHGQFHVLHWKQKEYEDERVLGTVHLKSGPDFLITSVSDPESQFFRVYGIRNNRVILIYSGGGASC